ncbi:IS1 family transposase [Shigella flexneri]
MAATVHWTPPQPGTHQKIIIDMADSTALDAGNRRIMGVGLNTILRHLKTQAAVGNLADTAGSDVIGCAEMDEQWGYVGAKSRQRWLFYAMTGYEDGCGRTSSADALGHTGASSAACCWPSRSWYG